MGTRFNYALYQPEFSLKENSERIGCTLSALKKYLRRTKSDRQFDSSFVRWKTINEFKTHYPNCSLREISLKLGFSVNTVRKYLTLTKDEFVASKRDNTKVSIFDTTNSNAIRSISASQTQILQWIMFLYNSGKPFDCDLTASTLKFYKDIPVPEFLFDKYPRRPNIKNLSEAEVLPDAIFSSVVVDLPFVVAPLGLKETSIIRNRFDYFESVEGLFEANAQMVALAFRLLKRKGILVVKTMDVNYAGKQLWVSDFVIQKAKEREFKLEDKFILTKANRLFNGNQQQRHARKYHSYFFVFRK